jgi:hypothetical protein
MLPGGAAMGESAFYVLRGLRSRRGLLGRLVFFEVIRRLKRLRQSIHFFLGSLSAGFRFSVFLSFSRLNFLV